MCAHVNTACESWLNVYGVLQFYMYVNNFYFVGPILIHTQTQVRNYLLYTRVHKLYMDSGNSNREHTFGTISGVRLWRCPEFMG